MCRVGTCCSDALLPVFGVCVNCLFRRGRPLCQVLVVYAVDLFHCLLAWRDIVSRSGSGFAAVLTVESPQSKHCLPNPRQCDTQSGTKWWFGTFIFPYIGNVMIPTDELIFFRGVGIPPTRLSSLFHLEVFHPQSIQLQEMICIYGEFHREIN